VSLDPSFVADCPYADAAQLIDEILSIDRETSTIVARMPTHDDLPITRDQRVHPTRHPRHVSGGLMIHASGILGFAHAYFILGLRHAEGWTGYGTHIHDGRFRKMGKIGEPMVLSGTALTVRTIRGVIIARYKFRFTQGQDVVYESEQSALFTQVTE
jgi:hypothetical protein